MCSVVPGTTRLERLDPRYTQAMSLLTARTGTGLVQRKPDHAYALQRSTGMRQTL